jgi:hypothetical protein
VVSAFCFGCRAADKQVCRWWAMPTLQLISAGENFPIRNRFERSEQRVL